jgi:predicted amidohydrolase
MFSTVSSHPDHCCRLAVHQGQSILYDISANTQQILKYSKLAKQDYNADIILFNELFLHGYELKEEHFLEKLKSTACESNSDVIKQISSIAETLGICICFGYAEKTVTAIYNSCAVIDHKGKLILNYRKTHLWWNDEKAAFSSGEELKVASLSLINGNTIIVSCLICYDVEFSECVRSVALQGCQLLLVPTALCIDLTTPLISLRARANDNHVFIAYSNHVNCTVTSSTSFSDNDFVGLSAIIAPDGAEIARAPSSSSLTAKINSVTMSIDSKAAQYSDRKIVLLDENNALLVANINTEMYRNAFTCIDFLHDRRPELYKNLSELGDDRVS